MRITVWVVLLVASGIFCGQGQDTVDDDAKAKVTALEVLWGQAAQMRDIKAMETLFDDSLTYVDVAGRLMTKAQVLAFTRAVAPVDIVVQSTAARAHGETVIVTGVLRLKGVDRRKPYLQYARFVDTWIRKDGRWLCVASMSTPIEH
ncbi:MAG TPA: nuclear transport factor 2 family protein [Candidatus Solibacter sp.]|nr:nuclear transport factor 2 family protein [Candidatus Solibacter sp.]